MFNSKTEKQIECKRCQTKFNGRTNKMFCDDCVEIKKVLNRQKYKLLKEVKTLNELLEKGENKVKVVNSQNGVGSGNGGRNIERECKRCSRKFISKCNPNRFCDNCMKEKRIESYQLKFNIRKNRKGHCKICCCDIVGRKFYCDDCNPKNRKRFCLVCKVGVQKGFSYCHKCLMERRRYQKSKGTITNTMGVVQN